MPTSEHCSSPSRKAPFVSLATVLLLGFLSTAHAAPSVPAGTPWPGKTPTATSITCDRDGDGALRADLAACGGSDCNDLNKKVNPFTPEGDKSTCQDGLDNNCDGRTDCADAGCDGQRVLTPGSITFESNGMCCDPRDGGVASVVNISTDSNNCGACRAKCLKGQSCIEGLCIGSCDVALNRCFTETSIVAQLQKPIERGPFGDFPGPIQRMLDAYLGDPSCPRPTREPKFDIKTFSKPLTDHRGRPTGESVRGVCVAIKF